jgi:hypothetical protein
MPDGQPPITEQSTGAGSLLRTDSPPIAGFTNAPKSKLAARTEWIALASSVAASLFLLGWVLLRCRSGFDFTDEGFYLNWISNPWNYHSSVTQFGFVYHPLYRLVGGDIVLLRQANVLISFALGCALCFAMLRSVFIQCDSVSASPRAGMIGAALVAGAGSLSFFDPWLPTPGYNSLTFQSLMLAATGVLLTGRELSKPSFAGWTLVGIGGGLAFLAKPTSAAMLGCIVAVYLAAAGKFRFRGLTISVAVAILLLVVSALAIDGSLFGFVRRIVDGMETGNRLLPGRSLIDIFRWDEINLSDEQKSNFIWFLITAFVAVSVSCLANGFARFCAALIAIVISALVIATIAGVLSPKISYEPFQPVQFSAVSFGIALAAMMFPARTYRRLSRNSLALIVFFAMLPYTYAFGTGNNYWSAAARAGLFWFLAGFVVCAGFVVAKAAWRQLLPAAAVALVVPTGVLYSAMENPYRQTQPLRLQMSAADIIPGQSRLFLPEETAAYIRELHQLSAASGFRAGAPALDLTGVSPGSLYAMGARPLGVAWTLGGYAGSRDFLTAALGGETCEAIAVSWILTEPDAADSFSPEILRPFGIDISTDYLDVGSISSTRSFAPKRFQQRLLKPARSTEAARLACENARRTTMSSPK